MITENKITEIFCLVDEINLKSAMANLIAISLVGVQMQRL